MMKFSLKDLFYIPCIIILIFFIFKGCGEQRRTNELINSIATYKDSANHYKNSYGNVIAYNQSLILENEKQLESIISKNEELSALVKKFKKISSITTTTTVITLPSDTVRLIDIIPCDFSPIKIKVDKQFYSYIGWISRKEFLLDSLTIKDDESIVIGTKKISLFKKENRVEILHTNPYIKTAKLGNYIIDAPKQRKWVVFGLGFLGGISGVLLFR